VNDREDGAGWGAAIDTLDAETKVISAFKRSISISSSSSPPPSLAPARSTHDDCACHNDEEASIGTTSWNGRFEKIKEGVSPTYILISPMKSTRITGVMFSQILPQGIPISFGDSRSRRTDVSLPVSAFIPWYIRVTFDPFQFHLHKRRPIASGQREDIPDTRSARRAFCPASRLAHNSAHRYCITGLFFTGPLLVRQPLRSQFGTQCLTPMISGSAPIEILLQ
jgi:hypothetical protein